MKKVIILVYSVFLMLFVIAIFCRVKKFTLQNPAIQTEIDTLWYDPLEGAFTTENTQYSLIYKEILRLNLKYPNIVMAQCILETGHFTSSLWQENHNLFGMKVAGSRPTTALNKSGYALYANWYDSLLDYALWQSKYATKLTEEEYYSLLSEIYASDRNYTEKVKVIQKDLNKYIEQ